MSNVISLSHNNQLISSPESIAYQRIILKKINQAGFNRGYGNGQTLAQVDFGTTYSVSCAKYTVQKLKNSGNPEENMAKLVGDFSKAICILYDIEFSQGLQTLYEEIIQEIPEFCINYRFNRIIKANISQLLALIILEDVYTEQPKYQAVLDVIASYEKYNIC